MYWKNVTINYTEVWLKHIASSLFLTWSFLFVIRQNSSTLVAVHEHDYSYYNLFFASTFIHNLTCTVVSLISELVVSDLTICVDLVVSDSNPVLLVLVVITSFPSGFRLNLKSEKTSVQPFFYNDIWLIILRNHQRMFMIIIFFNFESIFCDFRSFGLIQLTVKWNFVRRSGIFLRSYFGKMKPIFESNYLPFLRNSLPKKGPVEFE